MIVFQMIVYFIILFIFVSSFSIIQIQQDTVFYNQKNSKRKHNSSGKKEKIMNKIQNLQNINFFNQNLIESIYNKEKSSVQFKKHSLYMDEIKFDGNKISEATSNLLSVQIPSTDISLEQNSSNQYENSQIYEQNSLLKNSLNSSLIHNVQQQSQCKICLCITKKQNCQKISNCSHVFCLQCLKSYVQLKIQRFEQILCPLEGCCQILDQQSQFYRNLDDNSKNKYQRIHKYYITLANTSLKHCPKPNCSGKFSIHPYRKIICNECTTEFCPKCFLLKHEKSCDQNELKFLQHSLNCRRCPGCKILIQKLQGCNHITCICSHEFCYLCGQNWYKEIGHQCKQRKVFQFNTVEEEEAPNLVVCCFRLCKFFMEYVSQMSIFSIIWLIIALIALLKTASLLVTLCMNFMNIILTNMPVISSLQNYQRYFDINNGVSTSLRIVLFIIGTISTTVGLYKLFQRHYINAVKSHLLNV